MGSVVNHIYKKFKGKLQQNKKEKILNMEN